MIKLFLIMGVLFLAGCSEKAEPIEEKQPQESTKKYETGSIDTH